MRNLILGYKRGWNKWECLVRALRGQSVDVVTKNFDKITGPYDRVWSMAESLLPVQARLEQLYGNDADYLIHLSLLNNHARPCSY